MNKWMKYLPNCLVLHSLFNNVVSMTELSGGEYGRTICSDSHPLYNEGIEGWSCEKPRNGASMRWPRNWKLSEHTTETREQTYITNDTRWGLAKAGDYCQKKGSCQTRQEWRDSKPRAVVPKVGCTAPWEDPPSALFAYLWYERFYTRHWETACHIENLLRVKQLLNAVSYFHVVIFRSGLWKPLCWRMLFIR
jgi:hypothetical protein